jgi:NAD(P)-dependent dehydrogenase (short-subunit alcohol dehydrogenase family)
VRNQCIVVTGASRGIGAATAKCLADAGFYVVCLSRSGLAPQFAEMSSESAGRFFPFKCDVTDSQSVRAAFLGITRASGHPVVGLVNNAGLHLQGKSETFSIADFNRVIAANATSVLSTSQAAYPHICEAGGGLIVNIGSFFDKIGVRENAAYCASKAAVGALTRCLAVEWARKGIRVLNVAPGYITTDLNQDQMSAGPLRKFLERRIPAGQPGASKDVGIFVTSLFELKTQFLTGATLYIDGGQGMAL